ncbi:hypothetical protein NT6N_13120 [Oceaniferula spumae]|uniref:Host attachment protein n=1 Tax=Oceaniferula spumae TaxID=2979115 RepID=A0AAT9FJZ5_9BACT
MKKLLIITDLGQVRALHFKMAGDDPIEKDHLVELEEHDVATPVGASTTDKAGKFNRGFAAGAGNALSHASRGNLEGEMEKRTIEQVVEDIAVIAKQQSADQLVIAAPKSILNRLTEQLASKSNAQLVETLGVDLVKEPLAALEKRFLN